MDVKFFYQLIHQLEDLPEDFKHINKLIIQNIISEVEKLSFNAVQYIQRKSIQNPLKADLTIDEDLLESSNKFLKKKENQELDKLKKEILDDLRNKKNNLISINLNSLDD